MKSSIVHSPQSTVKSNGRPRTPFNHGGGSEGLRLRPSNVKNRDGVALVITLIMLSIITFMAVTFLVLSQRERSSVSTAMDQKAARNASDAGLARVSAELLTRIMLHTNFQQLDLVVSTNYINFDGLHGGTPGSLSPTNVNYDYLTGNAHPAITDPQDREINIASLLYNPRPPVYVVTNVGTGDAEFRYYLDLNRNGQYDKSGSWPLVVMDTATGKPSYVGTNGLLVSTNLPIKDYLVTNSFIGDPDWIGVLERPEEMHSADNRFIARYAYIVLPVGNTLDMNYIHNHAKRAVSTPPAGDGFLRNQGVGTWEINLAGFLADLNTNAWWNPPPGYLYDQSSTLASRGAAFTNANDFLNFRYGPGGYANLYRARDLLAGPPATLAASLAAYNIDVYSDGPLMLTTATNESVPSDGPANPWSGSENTNHFFSHQDVFSQMPASFKTVMSNLGTSNDSYNAYTFYRMLAQLGTDSAVETNKINVNFKNTDFLGHIVPGMETNLIPWTPIDFFTNAANRILAQFTNEAQVALSITNIPLYPTNSYTPAVHRALQLAANIFDATTNQTVPLFSGQTNSFFPSVFRPVFTSESGKVWISGFVEVTNTDPLAFQYYDMAKASNSPGPLAGVNIYGVPWVVGAKKGLPNFNEYSMETAISFARKLRLTKAAAGNSPITDVKQMFEVGISNVLGLEAWNSYTNPYPRNLRVSASNEVGMTITNPSGISLVPANWANNFSFQSVTNIGAGTWGPFLGAGAPNDKSIIVPLQSGMVFFTNATYLESPPQFIPNNPAAFLSDARNPMPELILITTNRVQYSVVDTTVSPNRVIDFVNLENISVLNISQAARNSTQCRPPDQDHYTFWCTNLLANTGYTPGISLNEGINYQLGVSMGVPNLSASYWKAAGADPANTSQENSFRDFLMRNSGNTNLVMQTPFNPTVFLYQHTSWQANDPLVHYTIGDLSDPAKASVDNTIGNPPLDNIGLLNNRYRPWGGNPGNPDPNTDENPAVKDPGIFQSSGWDFSTNKLSNIGLLGRVHRGTPWQTVYMKSPLVNLKDWREWSGNTMQEVNGNQDAALTMPNRDYGLFDLFTTAINGNATRGQLNVNQTNLAAWTAIFAGVNVLTNDPVTGVMGPAVIAPAGVYDTNNMTPMARIWQGILNTRANTDTNFTVFPNHTFQHVGDVLAAPELTVGSPFINTNRLYTPSAGGLNDELVERIPQQIMSLLTLNQSPRFVIYSFGQTLHPADHSLVIGGTFNNLCTNYQITAESAVRAVVHVEGTPDRNMVDGKVDSQGRTYPPHLVIEQFNVLGPD